VKIYIPMRKLFIVIVLFRDQFQRTGNDSRNPAKRAPAVFPACHSHPNALVHHHGRMYQSIFHLLGIHESVLTLSRIATAANFVNIVAPTAGAGGVALFAAEARRRGHPAGKATVAAALFLLLDQAAFLVILAMGLIVLFRRNDLDPGEVWASLFLLCIAATYAFVLYLGYRSAEKLGNLLAKVARGVNRLVKLFRRGEYLSEARAHEFAQEISEGFSGLTEKPSSLIRPVLWGIFDKGLLDAGSGLCISIV
jgi:uncharacterized membrane protein YbhN (UPF0104 family)